MEALNSWEGYALIAGAALLAGMINALAGGGTLITFPALVALGIPPVAANVTNTVALCPGYLGATLASWAEIKAQKERLLWLIPASILGGLLGGALLLLSGERLFRSLVPFLILLASLLLAVGEPVKRWAARRAAGKPAVRAAGLLAALAVGLAAVYGGYFGAGLSVIVLAVLGIAFNDSLTRLNALKQAVALCVNLAAAIYFVFSGRVVWLAAAVMALAALAGGAVGAHGPDVAAAGGNAAGLAAGGGGAAAV